MQAIAGAEPYGGSLALLDPQPIAAQALEAARTGLDRCIADPGLGYTFYLLTQLVLAARHEDWRRRLEPFGLRLSDEATLFDLTAEMQAAIDDHVSERGRPSDTAENCTKSGGQGAYRDCRAKNRHALWRELGRLTTCDSKPVDERWIRRARPAVLRVFHGAFPEFLLASNHCGSGRTHASRYRGRKRCRPSVPTAPCSLAAHVRT